MRKKIVLFLITICCFVVSADAANNRFMLVIDAGHGGHDAGAVGAITKEKHLTLRYALAFGRMVERNCPDVKVVYTRKTDRFVELYRRAEIANQNKADLFISIHINALPRGRVAHGFQTYTLGMSKRTGKKTGVLENLEVAKRENSVIFLEKDYKQTYHGYDPNSPESNIMFEFIQDKNMENSVELAKYMQRYVCQATGRQDMGAQQDNLAVLRLSSMPGCLVECGFISTRDEERFMNSKEADDRYARGLFNAFLAYRKRHGGNISIPFQQEPTPEKKTVEKKTVEKKVEEKRVEEIPQTVPQEQVGVMPSKKEPVKSEEVCVLPPEPQPQPQPEVQPVSVSEPQPVAPVVRVVPIFKVQFLAGSTLLKKGSPLFKGLTDVSHYRDGGMYKYTVGASEDYNVINRLRREVAKKFPEAFIIAFKNGVKMDVNEAIREFKSNKRK